MKKLALIFLLPFVGSVFGQGEDVRITADGTVINTKTVKFATGKLMVNGVAVVGGATGVTSVSGTAPIVSSGGLTPAISITAATTGAAGSMSASDKTKLDGIAAGAQPGTVTSVAVSGANGIGITGSPITTSGTIALSLGAITPASVAASGAVSGSNLSGTNTGDQTITLTGPVTGTGTGSFATTIANDTVTYAKLQNVSAASRVLGRKLGAGAGDVEEVTIHELLSFLLASQGDLIYKDAFDWATLPAGTDGYILMTHGTTLAPTWEEPSGGAGFINNTAFGGAWNGVSANAPAQNTVYDWGHTFDTDDDGKVNVLDQAAGIAVTDASGVLQSPIADNSSNWNTAFTDRLKWDGGTTGLVAATGRTSLGLVIGTDVAPVASPTFTGTVTIPTPFTLGAVSVLPTGTELNFVDGVTSSIQTQLDAKGVGTVTNFSAGDLSPLFTTSEATTTTTPALSFTLSNAAAHTIFGNFTGSSGAASYNAVGTGVDTWITTPSSANFAAAVTGETGTGNVVFSADPTFTGTVNATALTMSAFNTTNSQFKVGSFELQSYALNNGWLGDNVFFNGSNFVTRNTGAASYFYFAGNRIEFRNYNSVSAGTTLPQTTTLHISPTGFGVGAALANAVFTGSRFYVDFATAATTVLYDASNQFITTVSSTGGVTLDAVGSGAGFTFSDRIINTLPLRLKNYTVATLPAGTQGDYAFVTDALAPTYNATIVGGGAVVVPVFYNGTVWTAH